MTSPGQTPFETPGVGGLLAEYLSPQETQAVRSTAYPTFGTRPLDPTSVFCDYETIQGLQCHRNALSPVAQGRCSSYCKNHITDDLRKAFAFIDSPDPVILTKRVATSGVRLGQLDHFGEPGVSRELEWRWYEPTEDKTKFHTITRQAGGDYKAFGPDTPAFKTDDEFLAALQSGQLVEYDSLGFAEPASPSQIEELYGPLTSDLGSYGGDFSGTLDVTSNLPWLHDNLGRSLWSGRSLAGTYAAEANPSGFDAQLARKRPEFRDAFEASTALVPLWYRAKPASSPSLLP